MASAQAVEKIFANNAQELLVHDPDSTSAVIVTPDGGTTEQWRDMRDFNNFSVTAMTSALTGTGVTLVEIVGNTASDGSGTTVQIKTSGAVAADALGDQVSLECTAEELRQEGNDNSVDLRYVAARITVENIADEASVLYNRCGARHATSGLTAATVIA